MAGVYIKGMEMPRDGTYRMGLVVKEGKITAGLVEEESFADKDIEWFDCVLVPDHGDLIDRDTLLRPDPELVKMGLELKGIGVQSVLNAEIVIPAERGEDR